MKLKVALAGLFLMATTTYANALEAIGSLVISALLSVGAGGLLPVASAAAIGATAVGIGLSVANFAFSFLGRRPSANPNDIKTTSKGSEGPGRYAFGRVEIEGEIAFGNTAGYRIYRLLLHCFGQLSSIEEYFYDGRSITVDSDGRVSSPPWRTATDSFLNIQTKVGDGTETAWADLMTDFPTLWTADHRLRGITQSLIRALNPGTGDPKFLRLFQGGIKPLRLRARMGLFYDPRTETTEWSINGVLHCLHWMRQLAGNDDAIYDFADIALVADQAEELIPTLTGTAPRCSLSGGWKGALTTDIVVDMQRSAGIDVRETEAGLYTLEFVEDDPASELTLYDRHILDRDYKSGPDGAKRPNICKLSYFSPQRRYEVAELPLHEQDGAGEYIGADWARVPDEIEKYGEQEFPIELIFCSDASQAQRIARRMFHMARADFGTIRTNFAGMAAWGKRTITIEFPDVGVDGASVFKKCRIGTVRINDEEGTCEIPFQVIPDELTVPWDGTTMEVPAPPILEALEYESELDKPAVPSDAVVVQYSDLSYETRLKFSGVSGGDTAEAQYRTYTGGEPDLWASMEEYLGAASTGWFAWVAGDARDRADFRVAFYNSEDEGSYFSDLKEADPLIIDNTVPDAPTVVESTVVVDEVEVTGDRLSITLSQLRVVKLLVEHDNTTDPSGWADWETFNDVRPGITYVSDVTTGTPEPGAFTVNWRVSAFTSNGTQSAYVNGSYIVPGTL